MLRLLCLLAAAYESNFRRREKKRKTEVIQVWIQIVWIDIGAPAQISGSKLTFLRFITACYCFPFFSLSQLILLEKRILNISNSVEGFCFTSLYFSFYIISRYASLSVLAACLSRKIDVSCLAKYSASTFLCIYAFLFLRSNSCKWHRKKMY